MKELPRQLEDLPVFLVGIKGTGMTALAELLSRRGARVTGSDTHEVFYTDGVLRDAGIPFSQGFDPAHLDPGLGLVVHSAAYDPQTHPELVRARELGLPIMKYTDALGWISSGLPSAGVTGVHGKTTTTALAGSIAEALGLPATVLVGSAVTNFGGRSIMSRGWDFFVAETCEYRRHFLAFHPRWIILTSVEADHLDYFSGYEDIESAFIEYGQRLPRGGALIYCADDPGAAAVARKLAEQRPDIRLVPYGRASSAGAAAEPLPAGSDRRFLITGEQTLPGRTVFRLAGFDPPFEVRIPGRHTVLNAAAAAGLVATITQDLYGKLPPEFASGTARGIASFSGSKRRSEILGEAGGILFVDDYAHHPTALKTTIEGFRSFYPGRRIVADFMSHTYSRTKALLPDFAASFGAADLVLLHKIYASAREQDDGTVRGETLYEETRQRHPGVLYFNEVLDALPWVEQHLRPGDLFLTLGAGDNWRLGAELYERFKGKARLGIA